MTFQTKCKLVFQNLQGIQNLFNISEKKKEFCSTPEPVIWSCDSGQQIPCFDSF